MQTQDNSTEREKKISIQGLHFEKPKDMTKEGVQQIREQRGKQSDTPEEGLLRKAERQMQKGQDPTVTKEQLEVARDKLHNAVGVDTARRKLEREEAEKAEANRKEKFEKARGGKSGDSTEKRGVKEMIHDAVDKTKGVFSRGDGDGGIKE